MAGGSSWTTGADGPGAVATLTPAREWLHDRCG